MTSAIEQQLIRIRREAEEREAKKLAEERRLPYLDLSGAPIEADALKLLDEERARAAQMTPVAVSGRDLSLAVFNSENEAAKAIINQFESDGYKLSLFQVSLAGLEQAWRSYKNLPQKSGQITGMVEIEERQLADLSRRLVGLPAVKEGISGFNFQTSSTSAILEVILAGAVANRVSDVHFEPETAAVRIRFRIDGILNDISTGFPRDVYQSLVSRIKLLAGLKLDIVSRPQDGRFSVTLAGRPVELRVSVVPAEYGETIVIRVLDPAIINISLRELGLRPDDLEIVNKEIQRPHGMILNTGPTGSGKTTTLYGFLKQRHSPGVKIITIEDPIEYNLEGIEQTRVNPESGYTFANGLASIMRQDPDIILIGEIRDNVTAAAAVQAALTGHLVFSTVHANRAAAAIPRLLDLGIKPTSIGPALNLIMAQRLVRRLCQNCRQPLEPDADLEAKIKRFIGNLPARVDRNDYREMMIYRAIGCRECDGAGYRGRIGIFELLAVGETIEELIEKQTGEMALEKFAVTAAGGGMVTVQQDGILKVIKGVTDFTEVERVTGPLLI